MNLATTIAKSRNKYTTINSNGMKTKELTQDTHTHIRNINRRIYLGMDSALHCLVTLHIDTCAYKRI